MKYRAVILLTTILTMPATGHPLDGTKYIPLKENSITHVLTNKNLEYALLNDPGIWYDFTSPLAGVPGILSVRTTVDTIPDTGITLISDKGEVFFFNFRESQAIKIPNKQMDEKPLPPRVLAKGDTLFLSHAVPTVIEVGLPTYRYDFANRRLPIKAKDVTPSKLNREHAKTHRTMARLSMPDSLETGFTDTLSIVDTQGNDYQFIIKLDPNKAYPYYHLDEKRSTVSDSPIPLPKEKTKRNEPSGEITALEGIFIVGPFILAILLGVLLASSQRRRHILEERLEQIERTIKENSEDTFQQYGKIERSLTDKIEKTLHDRAEQLRAYINPSVAQYNADIEKNKKQAINEVMDYFKSVTASINSSAKALQKTTQLRRIVEDAVQKEIKRQAYSETFTSKERKQIIDQVTTSITDRYDQKIEKLTDQLTEEFKKKIARITSEQIKQKTSEVNESLEEFFRDKKEKYLRVQLDNPLAQYVREQIKKQIKHFFIEEYGFVPLSEPEHRDENDME